MFEISCEEWESVDRLINILHNKDGLPKSSFKIPAKKYPELQLTRSFFCIFNSNLESYQLFAKPKNNLDPEETLKGGLNLVYKLVSINGKKIILKKRKYKPKKINESDVNQQQINRDEFRKTINLYRADGFYKVHKENDKIVSFTTYDFEEKADGEDLCNWLNYKITNHQFISLIDFRTIVLNIVNQINEMYYSKGFAHCDLKSENIILEPLSLNVKIIDIDGVTPFGNSISITTHKSGHGTADDKEDIFGLTHVMKDLLNIIEKPQDNNLYDCYSLFCDCNIKTNKENRFTIRDFITCFNMGRSEQIKIINKFESMDMPKKHKKLYIRKL